MLVTWARCAFVDHPRRIQASSLFQLPCHAGLVVYGPEGSSPCYRRSGLAWLSTPPPPLLYFPLRFKTSLLFWYNSIPPENLYGCRSHMQSGGFEVKSFHPLPSFEHQEIYFTMSTPSLKINTSFGEKLVPFVRVLPPPPPRSKRAPPSQTTPRIHMSSPTPTAAPISPHTVLTPQFKKRPLSYPGPRYTPLELTPRPFQELHNERCYLLQSLQRENEKATALLHKISSMEGGPVEAPGVTQSRRRIKNQLRWFRQRLVFRGPFWAGREVREGIL